MIDEMKANSQDLSNIVTEHVGHEDVGVLALTHIHRIRDIADHIEVGVEELESRMEKIDLELLLLLPVGLPRQDLVDELEVRSLHDLNNPPKTELHPIFLHVVRCL